MFFDFSLILTKNDLSRQFPDLVSKFSHVNSESNSIYEGNDESQEDNQFSTLREQFPDLMAKFQNVNPTSSSIYSENSNDPLVGGGESINFPNLNFHFNMPTPANIAIACEVCGKNFTTTTTLKRHMKIHTGEKTFECVICERKFGRSSHLKRHMETHNKDKKASVPQYQFPCQICGKRFSRTSHVKRHEEIHIRKGCLTREQVCYKAKFQDLDPKSLTFLTFCVICNMVWKN